MQKGHTNKPNKIENKKIIFSIKFHTNLVAKYWHLGKYLRICVWNDYSFFELKRKN